MERAESSGRTRVREWTRWVLLGPETGWGARVATGRGEILLLACFALLMHVLDLVTGLRMMLVHGISLEQNPLARSIMLHSGPLALAEVKLGVVLLGLLVMIRTAELGRARLARNCLLLAAGIGLLGWSSNLIG